MKTAIVLSAAFIIAASFTVSTRETSVSSDSFAADKYIQPFSKIIIEDDIDVALVESSERTVSVAGINQDMSKVNWKIKNSILHISSKSGSLKDKVLVTVGVNGLKEIEINGESSVKSLGNIVSASLYVHMNGLGKANIINLGKIVIENGEGVKMEVKKKTANVTVLANET